MKEKRIIVLTDSDDISEETENADVVIKYDYKNIFEFVKIAIRMAPDEIRILFNRDKIYDNYGNRKIGRR